jgi:hypothetical protein
LWFSLSCEGSREVFRQRVRSNSGSGPTKNRTREKRKSSLHYGQIAPIPQTKSPADPVFPSRKRGVNIPTGGRM